MQYSTGMIQRWKPETRLNLLAVLLALLCLRRQELKAWNSQLLVANLPEHDEPQG